MAPTAIRTWHDIVERRTDPAHDTTAAIAALLSNDPVFRSPAVHTPQQGHAVTLAYLSVAVEVLGPHLTYHREWYADDSAVLEFTTELDGIEVHGIDLIRWGADDRIEEFTVMVRPQKALTRVIELMGAALARRAGA